MLQGIVRDPHSFTFIRNLKGKMCARNELKEREAWLQKVPELQDLPKVTKKNSSSIQEEVNEIVRPLKLDNILKFKNVAKGVVNTKLH